MLVDPRRIKYACNFYENPVFSRSMATTKDWQGRILADVVSTTTIEATAAWLLATVQSLLDGRSVELDPLRRGTVPKRGGDERVIWVASYRRRALSNLIAGVLQETTTHLLRPHVRAYIPGARDVVKETILDVAEVVAKPEDAKKRKMVYFINEDIRNCFDELSHSLIHDALEHYGFESRVRALVMASVQAPRWVGGPRDGALVTYSKSVPMGLAESSVLANLSMFELDEALAAMRHTHVQRYSDNVLVIAKEWSSATHAARVLMRWARKRGLKLKAVHHQASPGSRIRDVRKERISFLGAEIDHHGTVRMPAAIMRDRINTVGEQVLALDKYVRLHGLRFSGRSRYA